MINLIFGRMFICTKAAASWTFEQVSFQNGCSNGGQTHFTWRSEQDGATVSIIHLLENPPWAYKSMFTFDLGWPWVVKWRSITYNLICEQDLLQFLLFTYPFQRRIDTAYLIHSVIRRPEISYLKTPLSKHYQLPQLIETWQKIWGLNSTA